VGEFLILLQLVKLFEQRAKAANPRFVLDFSNVCDVARICAKLDGIPLAIELAAARVRILKPAQMLKKLTRKFDVLKSPRRDLTPRQQTLEGAITWSYDLLEPWEQCAFAQLSVCVAGFNLDTAEALLDLSQYPQAPAAMDAVQALRDKSLLTEQEAVYEMRFGMYESIRDFGAQCRTQLLDAQAETALWHRFAVHLVEYAEEWNDCVDTIDGVEALNRLSLERENLFAVQEWALQAEAPDLAPYGRLGHSSGQQEVTHGAA